MTDSRLLPTSKIINFLIQPEHDTQSSIQKLQQGYRKLGLGENLGILASAEAIDSVHSSSEEESSESLSASEQGTNELNTDPNGHQLTPLKDNQEKHKIEGCTNFYFNCH